MGKGGGAQTVGYKYFVGLHWTFCHGPIDKLIQIRVDKKPIWAGGQNSGAIAINQPDLFGGDGREGGVSGTLDILSGSPTQAKNAYLVGVLGNLVSAYRGFGGLVARQFYIGNNPYLKQWDFLIQRVFLADEGVDQWYKAKAGIVSPNSLTVSQLTNDTALPANSSSSDGHAEGYNFDCSAGSAIVVGTTSNADAWSYTPSDNYNLSEFPKTWTFRFGIRSPSGAVTTYWPETYLTSAEATAAKADQQISIQATETGTYRLFLYDAEVDDNRGVGHFTIGVGPGLTDMNPAHMIRECLTNQTWGMGYPESDMGDSFTACADTLFGESFGLSLEWKDDSAIEDFVKDVMRYIDAVIQVDRNTGKFELKLIRNDYDISTLLHLNPSNVDKVSDYSFQKFGELISTVSVEWWDSANQTTKLTTVTDGALAAAQDNDIAISNKYPGITNAYLANRVAARDLRVNSTPIRSCTVYATAAIAKNLKLGGVFLLTWPVFSIANLPMRITAISYGDGATNRVRIGCTEDNFGINNDTLITTTTEGGWENPKSPPGAATDTIAFEVPYLEAVQRHGQAQIDALDATAGYVGMAASGAPRAINARLWTDAGAGYANAGPVDFCPAARLNAAIDEIATSIVVKNENNFDQLTPQTWFQCDDELLNFISYNASTHTITVARGLLDTVPAKHAANALCLFWDYDNGVDTTEYASGETVKLKLLTANGSGALPLSAATENTIVVSGRLARPYPPGNFKVNGAYFPTTPQSGDLIVTWAHRDRTQQTSGSYIGFSDTNVGPETGVKYRIRIYNADTNALLFTYDAITANTYDVPSVAAAVSNVKLVLDSYRGSLFSYQAQIAQFPYAAATALLSGSFYGKTAASYIDTPIGPSLQPLVIAGTRVSLPSDTAGTANILRLKDKDTSIDLATPAHGYIDFQTHRDSESGSQTVNFLLGVTDYTALTCWIVGLNGTHFNYAYHARFNANAYSAETISNSAAGADSWNRIVIANERIAFISAATQAGLNIALPDFRFAVTAGTLAGGVALRFSNPTINGLLPFIDTITVVEASDYEIINLQFEGPNNSQTFIDSHGSIWTPDNTDPVLSNISPLSGTTSGIFPNSKGISTPWPVLLDLSGAFTFELEWEPPSDFGGTIARFVGSIAPVYGNKVLCWYCDHGSFRMYTGTYGIDDNWQLFNDLVPVAGVKCSIAITRDENNVLRMFKDGVMSSNTPTIGNDWTNLGRLLRIGNLDPNEAAGTIHTNKLDNVRISTACKYTANYTP